jgi:hypothetical protein
MSIIIIICDFMILIIFYWLNYNYIPSDKSTNFD